MKFVYYESLNEEAKKAYDTNDSSGKFYIDNHLGFISLKDEKGNAKRIAKVIKCKMNPIVEIGQ